MIDVFGIGVAQGKGIMKGRLVFPIHDRQGRLVAYCGRWVEKERPDDEPKYRQLPNFRKDLELFNWHRVCQVDIPSPVVIVESFFSVMTLHEMNVRAISPMGRSLSEAQVELLQDGTVTRVALLFDGDDPGRKAIITAGRQLLEAGMDVVAPVVPEDFKPHRSSAEDIRALLRA